MKLAPYRAAIEWLATESGIESHDTWQDINSMVIVGYTADLYGTNANRVTNDILAYFRKYGFSVPKEDK